MSGVAVLLAALVAISAVVAAILAVAWYDLGEPRHARTWSIAFGIAALAWSWFFLVRAGIVPAELVTVTPTLIGFASVLVVVGFRQRAALPNARLSLLLLAAAHGALLAALEAWFNTDEAWVVPLTLLNGGLYWRASRTLVGRRQGERLAEKVAEAGLCLLATVHLMVFAGIVGEWLGLVSLDLPRLGDLALLLLPTVETSIGLYTVILITVDLADQTRRLAATDRLTGLFNRRGFDETGNALFAAARRSGRPVAMVMIDIDDFKEVNDRFGHPAGDRVLCGVSQRIAQAIGRRDIFARIGGEEFAAVLVDADLGTAACAAEAMRLQVEAMAADLPEPHGVTASFGLATIRPDDADLHALLARADRALYRSKAEGRNRVTLAG
jgi:diguanylate cyclase (GGDEF)-like protein